MNFITYAEALRDAQEFCLSAYPNVFLMGLGVPDPKAIFGSTLGLLEKFGSERVFDIPLSENAMTGVALGSAVMGMRPILTHQRVDFALTSVEQIVNQCAKWSYMFGGAMSAPMVIRMVIGRGWGQGPQHSQSLHSWFAHIPGLKIIMPATPIDAKGMLISAVEDENPVISLEHRWLFGVKDNVPPHPYRVPIGRARVVRDGYDITLVAVSYMVLECLRAAGKLAKIGVSAEVVDLRTIKPLDEETILDSVRKTGNVLTVDHAQLTCSIASEVSALVAANIFGHLKSGPRRLGLPDYPVPTSPALSDDYYPVCDDVVRAALSILGRSDSVAREVKRDARRDQPDASFNGPF